MTTTSLDNSNKSMQQHKIESKLQENSTTEFKSVLRIRPLLNIRKERNDEIVSLEPVVDAPTVVTLHPQQLSVLPNNISNTSSAMGSPPQQAATTQQQDIDYHFDHVLGSETSQDKVYLSLGLPIAKDLMEQLKQDIDKKGNRLPKSHLVVTMGHAGSGKTYTSIGSSSLSSVRKSEADGIIPRIVESLFSQSKHSVTASTKKKLQFAIMLSVVQVHQSKINPNDSDMYDVLQEDMTKRLVGGTTFSSILQNIDISMNSSTTRNRNKNGTKSTNLVEVQHDTNSCDCAITNLIPHCCTTVEMARQYLQIALHRSRKSVRKHYQLHTLIQLETVLIDRNDGISVKHTGGRFAVLDMAAYEGTKQPRSGRSFKDSLPNRDDAHSAILHCLRAIQYNQQQQGRSKIRKKVPFLQNKVTMLLQPFFSPRLNCSVNVVLLLALSSSQREYDEKKELLTDLESVHRPSLNAAVSTGVADVARTRQTETCNHSSSSRERMPKKIQQQSSKCSKKVAHNPANSEGSVLNRNTFSDDADDELSRNEQKTKHDDTNEIPIQRIECKTLPQQRYEKQNDFKETSKSTSTEEVQSLEPLPPPVAPHYESRPHLPSTDFSSFQSVDFPGTSIDTFSNYSPQNTSVFGDGVPLVLQNQDTRSTEREKHCPDMIASAPIEDPADDPRYSGAQLLNYMKTFNRMVNASKKKGREVIEKISVSASLNSSGNPNKDAIIDELQTRMMKFDRKNAKLIRENEWLRQQNMQLLHETTELKLSRQRQRTGTNEYGLSDHLSEYDNDSQSSASTHQGDTDSTVCMNQVHLDDGKQIATLSNDDERKFEPYHRSATTIQKMELVDSMNESEQEQGNSLGDPFFQHVAQLYDDEVRETNRWGKATTSNFKKNSGETMRACNRADMEASSTSGNLVTKPATKFENENNENQHLMHKYEDTNKHPDSLLFEHMAQMDKHW